MVCNIAIPAPTELAQKAIKLSHYLESFDSAFTLDGVNYIPHLTLYMTEFDENDLDMVIADLEDLTSTKASFSLIAEKFFMNATNYIDIQYLKSPELIDFHLEAMSRLSPYRKISDIKPENFSGPDAKEMYANTKEFGYSIGKNLYRPHVTLTKLNHKNPEPLKTLKWDAFNFTASKVGIFEADDLGCCRRPIKLFDLN